MKIKHAFGIVIMVLATSCGSLYYSVSDEKSDDKIKSSGIPYFLPKAVLHVDLVVNKYQFIPGPYADYASMYLNLDANFALKVGFS